MKQQIRTVVLAAFALASGMALADPHEENEDENTDTIMVGDAGAGVVVASAEGVGTDSTAQPSTSQTTSGEAPHSGAVQSGQRLADAE